MASCASPLPDAPAHVNFDPPSPPQVTPVAEVKPVPPAPPVRVNGRIDPLPGSGGTAIRRDGDGMVTGDPSPKNYVAENGDVSLNYADADVREIARLILGDILKLNYSIDPGFMGTVTIQTPRPLKREALLPTLESLLEQAGGRITFSNGVFRIGPTGDDAVIPPVIANGSIESGTEVVALRYASARQLGPLLEPYIGDSVKMIVDPARNVLLVSGTASARGNVVDLIRVFDVDYLAGQSYALFPAKTGDPTKLAANLGAALQLDSDGPLAGAIKIVPIDEASAIMVIAKQPAYLDRAARLIAELEQIQANSGRNIHVYYLRNAQASDIQPLLQRAVNPPAGGAGIEIGPGNIPPTATPAQISGPPAAPAAGPGAAPGQAMGPGAAPAAAAPPPPVNNALSGAGEQVAGGNAKGPQIIADPMNSALIIVATEAEYGTIEAAIRKLDILPMQVLVEATIAEVTLNDQLQYGTQFFLSNKQGQATLSNAVSPNPTLLDPANPVTNGQLFPGILAPAFPAFAIARTIGNQQFAVQALKDITNVQIISAPKLLIVDKQQARLQVGDLVPTITQSATSVIAAGAPVVNNVQYQATGVILTVTPRINSGGLVTLDIEQEVSDVVPTNTSSINSPTFQQRKIQTRVVVQDGETISLGGLISQKKTKDNSGIPYLQNIPVFGSLFSTKTNTNDRTELLILLTPRVVSDQRDARALTDELRRKLVPSTLLP